MRFVACHGARIYQLCLSPPHAAAGALPQLAVVRHICVRHGLGVTVFQLTLPAAGEAAEASGDDERTGGSPAQPSLAPVWEFREAGRLVTAAWNPLVRGEVLLAQRDGSVFTAGLQPRLCAAAAAAAAQPAARQPSAAPRRRVVSQRAFNSEPVGGRADVGLTQLVAALRPTASQQSGGLGRVCVAVAGHPRKIFLSRDSILYVAQVRPSFIP